MLYKPIKGSNKDAKRGHERSGLPRRSGSHETTVPPETNPTLRSVHERRTHLHNNRADGERKPPRLPANACRKVASTRLANLHRVADSRRHGLPRVAQLHPPRFSRS